MIDAVQRQSPMIVPDAVFGAAVIAGSSSVPPQLFDFYRLSVDHSKIQSRLDLAGNHTLHHIFTACTLDLCVS